MQISDDLLYGAEAISKETGIPRSSVYRLAARGDIPAFRIGSTIAARRSELREALTAKSNVV